MAHIPSSVSLSVVMSTRAKYLALMGNVSSRQNTFLVRTPPLHVFEHPLHSLVFHLNSVRGLHWHMTQFIALSCGYHLFTYQITTLFSASLVVHTRRRPIKGSTENGTSEMSIGVPGPSESYKMHMKMTS